MKTAIVTGASRRLGLHITERLLEKKWRVYAFTRDSSSDLNQLAEEFRNSLKIVRYLDVDANKIINACEEVKADVSSIDLIVNNASVFDKDANHDGDFIDYYTHLFNVHMLAPAIVMKEMKCHLRQSYNVGAAASNIINVTDIYTENPSIDYGLYCSTKAGLENLSLWAAKAYAPFCKVNTIKPGPVMFLPSHSQSEKSKVEAETLLQVEPGFGPVFQMIMAIVDNGFVTGASFKVDGGRSIR
jgi:dihydromonapterin reductase / dihydrofolate reductase